MNIEQVKKEYIRKVGELGRATLSTIYPRTFEHYMMGLELKDYQDNIIDYFSFIIMPQSISKTEPVRSNIKQTSSGSTVLTSNSFAIQDITIKGNFARTFKISTASVVDSIRGVAFSLNKGAISILDTKNQGISNLKKDFFPGIQTGFGAISTLKSIINKSVGIDGSGNPFKLYLYNMALGESYLVAVDPNSGITVSQNMDKNMIWEYSILFKILAPISTISPLNFNTSLLRATSINVLQKSVDDVVNNLIEFKR